MHKRSTPEEYVELAEICLFEADLALDREGAGRLRIMARRYLEEAERVLKESERADSRNGGGIVTLRNKKRT
jgi:hypothetical protein